MSLPSKASIEKVSMEILKQSKALDVFPTPVDQILSYTELELDSSVDLSIVEQSFLDRLSEKLQGKMKSALQLVRGFLDREDKIIYLDLSQTANRKRFVKLHETGHQALPWQNEIMAHLENDETLDPYTLEEFEAEANYFASITLFQQDRFNHELNKLPLSIKSPMVLGDKFGASKHASLRRYVECSKNRCALLVLKEVSLLGEVPNCLKRNFFSSKSFSETFGTIELPDNFGYTWSFTRLYYHGNRFIENQDITLATENGEADFTFDYFNNTYNAFVFLFPVGEFNSSKTQIVLSGTN